jgi:hypothetical protein
MPKQIPHFVRNDKFKGSDCMTTMAISVKQIPHFVRNDRGRDSHGFVLKAPHFAMAKVGQIRPDDGMKIPDKTKQSRKTSL